MVVQQPAIQPDRQTQLDPQTPLVPQNQLVPQNRQNQNSGLLGGLVGGLVGGLADMVDTTLNTAVHTVTGVVGTVDIVGQIVLPPSLPGGEDYPPPLAPIDGVLGPVFSGGSASGGVSATVPTLIGATVAPAGATGPAVTEPVPAATGAPSTTTTVTTTSSAGGSITEPFARTGSTQTHQQDSGTHVGTGGGGSGGGGGLPASPSAPMAPTTTATPGHDNSAGARQTFAVSGDNATTTQLKLIGVSRDHEVDGAGREAALPTTSPD